MKTNTSVTGTCGCKRTKTDVLRLQKEKKEKSNQKGNVHENISLLKEYKELLDSGIITEEEFEIKKKQLL